MYIDTTTAVSLPFFPRFSATQFCAKTLHPRCGRDRCSTLRLFVKVKLVLVRRPLDLAAVRVLEVGLDDVVAVLADRAETGLLHDGGDDGAAEGVVAHNQAVEIDLGGERHLAGDRREDEAALATVAQVRELNLAVEATRTEEGGVEGVGAVGGHDDLDVGRLVETVHLVEELEENTLHLAIGTGLRVKTLGGDGVNLVDKNDGRRVLAGHPEHVAHHARALTEVFLHKLGANDADEVCRCRVGHSLDQHGLASSRGSVEQHTARGVDTDLLVEVEVRQGELDSLPNLLLLHVQATNIGICNVGLLVGAEHGNRGIGLRREDVDQGIGVAVQGDRRGRLELLTVEGREDTDDVVGTGA